MLLCCWLAAVGAGLLKSEEILEGVARLRISNDVEFEEQNFMALMNEANEVRVNLSLCFPQQGANPAIVYIVLCLFGVLKIEKVTICRDGRS